MNRFKLSNRVLHLALASLCLFALLSSSSFAADSGRDLAMVAPAEVGMSQEGLDKLTAAMQQMVDDGELVGIVTAVSRHGKLVHFESFGYQDRDAGIAMKKDTIVRIYSMTKPVTGAVLMTLYEKGKFTLDDAVEDYIPELKDLKVAAEDGPDGNPIVEDADHKMTIRELMSHTGGLAYGLSASTQVDRLYRKHLIRNGDLDREITLKEFVGKLSKIPLRDQPGSAWNYSVSVDVQGYLVEVLTGKTFDQVLSERIFEPLGMNDTAFWVPPTKADRLYRMYSRGRDGKETSTANDVVLAKPAFFSGGGGLVSTAPDFMRFAQMMLNGGELDGVRILKPETVELMHTNQLQPSIEQIHPMIGNPGNTFGLDFAIVERPDGRADHALAKGEYWWYGIGGTWFGINPIQDTVVVGMIQSFGFGASRKARFSSKRLVYEAITDPVH